MPSRVAFQVDFYVYHWDSCVRKKVIFPPISETMETWRLILRKITDEFEDEINGKDIKFIFVTSGFFEYK